MRNAAVIGAGLSKAAGLALGLMLSAAAGSSAHGQISAQPFLTGFTFPVYATSPAGDFDRTFVVEKVVSGNGRIRIHKASTGTVLATPFLTVGPLRTGNEQGLLGLAFHPQFATNGKFYVYYTDAIRVGDSVIAEYRVSADNPDVADPASRREVLRFIQPQENHNGGWIGFGPDGYLYIASGDGGGSNDSGSGHSTGGNAQDITSNLLGKMLRIDVDGADAYPADPNKNFAIPADNPFQGATTGDDEIWAYGLRNPWRNSFDRLTGEMWIADVGQNSWEEINVEPAGAGGRNYGWRCMEGEVCTGLSGCTCFAGSLTMPVWVYNHDIGCSVTGGYVYRGCRIPSLYGKYVFADYCSGTIWAYDRATDTVQTLFNAGFGVTSFGEDAYGELLIVSQGGSVRRIVQSPAQFTDCNANGRPDCWDIADGRSTDRNGNGVPDECDPPCGPDFNGDGFLDFFDFSDFVECFEGGPCPPGQDPDYNNDGFPDFFDYDDFIADFETGC